jgi:hypothetical protein
MNRFLFLIVILLFAAGCKKDKTTEQHYSVSGKVSNIDANAGNVTLLLSNSEHSYSGVASATGDFAIPEVAPGQYNLRVSQDKTQGHVERNISTNVEGQDVILELILPEPVQIFSPAHTDRSITLSWTRSSDSGFREYKVYRGYTAGLDETTGELIQVFTDRTDTGFIDGHGMSNNDGLQPGVTYFYRVMVMDDYGKLAGSKVLAVTTDSLPSLPEMYKLQLVTSFSGNYSYGGIYGIAYDGNAVWVAYLLLGTGYYDSTTIRIVKYDYGTLQPVKTFTYHDVFGDVGGIDFDGSRLWLSYSLTTNGSLMGYCSIDTATGVRQNTYTSDYGVEDLAYYNGVLYLNYYYNTIDKINPMNGGLLQRLTTDLPTGTNCKGLAVRADEMWVTHWLVDPGILYILDESGKKKGYVSYSLDGTKLCFMNEQLLMADPSRVYIYNITSTVP